MEVKTEFSVRMVITNMSDELFNDALYYMEKALVPNEQFLKWRYLRSAVMCFCASAEAWMNALMVHNLRSLPVRNEDEQKLLNFLTDPDYKGKMPKGFTVLEQRLKKYLPGTFKLSQIGNNANIEKYVALSKTRNMLMHYAYKDHEKVYNDHLEQMAREAPNIIQALFDEYHRLGNPQPTPPWFKNRQSRVIV